MRLRVSHLIILLFLGFLVAGLSLGEFQAVLANAVAVCLSCIGIQ